LLLEIPTEISVTARIFVVMVFVHPIFDAALGYHLVVRF
jgi:hypothetical protein